jgi:hypothetical protein
MPVLKTGDYMALYVGDWCYQNHVICEHNRLDSSDRVFACSGNFNGVCVGGSKYSFPPSKLSADTKEQNGHIAQQTNAADGPSAHA